MTWTQWGDTDSVTGHYWPLLTVTTGACGIVYCLSRDETQQVSKQLEAAGVSAGFYHAGMGNSDRRRVQQAWQRGAASGGFDVVCATIAMGMGIDKPDVRRRV